jgi:hypothetical protein
VPVFASFTLEFALQLRKRRGKPSIRVRKASLRLRKTSVRVHITNTPTHYKETHTHTHTHTLQNNIKPLQYKLKQTTCKIYPNEIVTI